MSEIERIARLEQRADNHEQDTKQLVEKVDNIANDIHEIRNQLSNWRGFFAGAAFAIASLAGLIGAGLTAAYTWFTGK